MEMIKNIMKIINNFTKIKSIRHFAQNICLFIILGLATLTSAQTNSSIWTVSQDSSWEDLKLFLPEAKMHGTSIWVSLLPPSKTPPINPSGNYSEPFRLDFIRWAEEIAKLSLRYSNIKGYGIENLQENLNIGYLTQNYINNVKAAGTAINPKLQFISIEPLSYNLWYVDRDATGNGSGTSWENASNTVAAVFTKAIDAGDTVYVSGGTDSTLYNYDAIINKHYYTSPVVVTRSWESGHNGKVLFGWIGDVSYPTQGTGCSFYVYSVSNVKLTNLTFTGAFATGDGHLTGILRILACQDVIIDRDTIISIGKGYGLNMIGGGGYPSSRIVITNNYIITETNTEVDIGNDPMYISYNYGGHTITGNTLIQRSINSDLSHTDIVQMYREGGHTVSDKPEFIFANNLLIMDNPNNTTGQAFYAEDMYSNRFLFYNNIIVGVRKMSGMVFQKNTSDTTALSVRVFNNTVVTDSSNQDTFLSLDTLIVKNNIFYLSAIDDRGMLVVGNNSLDELSYIDIDYNQYYRTTTLAGDHVNGAKYGASYTWDEWQALGYDTHSNIGIVNFAKIWGTNIADYKLSVGSSCIDTGTPVSIFNNDIEGTLRPEGAAWDKGAYEFKD